MEIRFDSFLLDAGLRPEEKVLIISLFRQAKYIWRGFSEGIDGQGANMTCSKDILLFEQIATIDDYIRIVRERTTDDAPTKEITLDVPNVAASDAAANATPQVFMSYSHDSVAHKQWVAKLSAKLVENGVTVIFDEWDCGPGDDLPKFMEQGVTASDRVLMICTESYVAKADDGKGGAGYEAMIVTSELVENLGSNKFIPVIRQESSPRTKPISLRTKRHINLSNDADYASGIDELLRTLHNASPPSKPPLGKSPFIAGVSRPASNADAVSVSRISPNIGAHEAYTDALRFARARDVVGYRRMMLAAKGGLNKNLPLWQESAGAQIRAKESQPDAVVRGGLNLYEPLIACILAGIESTGDQFRNHKGVVSDILLPLGWQKSGIEVITELPSAAVFVLQGLNGAMCVTTDQLPLAIDFVSVKVRTDYAQEAHPIFLSPWLMGYPASFGSSAHPAWDYLSSLSVQWEWLMDPFGSEGAFKEALVAYYLALNIMEFVARISNDGIQGNLLIPLSFLREEKAVLERAYQRLLADPSSIQSIWRSREFVDEEILRKWPDWVKTCELWMWDAKMGHLIELPHKKLHLDIRA